MRTFTVVPSFEGESAFFELPDIGFQGDHLSFAILFNLTELVEHWPNITPSMIVTDPKGNTFIAPHTSWNLNEHIFTWSISDVETAYDGFLKCQLKCTSADDPDVIVCMSRICQTKVYPSLAASTEPPEAFQTWVDTLVRLGAEISEDANVVIENASASETNARTAASAAEAAELSKNAVEAARISIEQTAGIAIAAQEGATNAQQRATNAAIEAEASESAAKESQTAAEQALEEIDSLAEEVVLAKNTVVQNTGYSETYMSNARAAQAAAEQARDAAVVAKGQSEVARDDAEDAQGKAIDARNAAQAAQSAAEGAQAAAEQARDAAVTAKGQSETARDESVAAKNEAENAEDQAKKWAIGVGRDGNPVGSSDQTFQNNAKYWADNAKSSRDTIVDLQVTSVTYSDEDESLTFFLGGESIVNHAEGV